MIEKIKSLNYGLWLKRLHDVRTLGLGVFVILVLLTTWSGIKVIQTNYELEKRIVTLQQQNEVQELENANLRLRNQYYNTDQFLELAARRQFGKAAPGEKVMLVPKEVALRHAVDVSGQAKSEEPTASADKPTYQKNFEAWINFFLHRSPADKKADAPV